MSCYRCRVADMLLFEEHAPLLLLLHAFCALATVALTTHLVVWLRPWLRGKFSRRRSVRRFALLSLSAYALTMLFGMALYPSYRVRVRGEYLENPRAITRATEARAEAAKLAARRNLESQRHRLGQAGTLPPMPEASADEERATAIEAEARVGKGARLVRWFDVKEHWSALGLMLAGAIALILLSWKPDAESTSIRRSVFALAVASAATAWAAAIIGLLISAAHSVAAL